MSKPKLLFFINTLNFGGAERVVSQLLQHLTEEYELHLALYTPIIKYSIPEEVKLVDLKEDVLAGNIKTLLRLPFVAKKLAAYCKESKIDTCVSFLNRPCYVNAMMRSFWGYWGKSIMCERSHQSSILNYIGGGSILYKKITKFLIHYAYQRADLVIANSKVSRTDLIQNFNITKQIEVIYNPIDIASTIEKAGEPLPDFFDTGYFYFVSTGNFRVEKNFALLIEAFAKLTHLPVRLVLVGGGALENSLKQLATELKIEDKITFTGFQTNPYKYIQGSDCFVLSSNTEGFPNVLLEALTCGKAVISTDCLSGPRELLAPNSDITKQIKNENELADYGILTPVSNANKLAEAMETMYKDDLLRKKFEVVAKTRGAEFDVLKIKQEFLKAFSL